MILSMFSSMNKNISYIFSYLIIQIYSDKIIYLI